VVPNWPENTQHILILSLGLSLIITLLALILSTKDHAEEKSSVYECGFAPVKEANKPFSVRFFTVAILFLVFDLEVILVFP